MLREKRKSLTNTGAHLLTDYIKACKKLKRYPTKADLLDLGYNRDTIRDHFGSILKLKQQAKLKHPEIASAVIEDRITDPSKIKGLDSLLKKYDRFVITSASDGAAVHKGFLKSLKTYCKVKNALLLILPAGNTLEDIDPVLADETWVFDQRHLNSNIYISSIKVPAKTVDPLTSLSRIGQRNGSTIVASPKQFLEFVPVGDNKMPHAMMTTGAITLPKYANKHGVQVKSDTIALHDHVMGAIVVEIASDKFYHFTQIQAEDKGAFVERGERFDGGFVSKMLPTHFVIGDRHVTETDPTAEKSWEEVSEAMGHPILVEHDFFSGVSVNHHEEFNMVNRAILAGENKLSLEQELTACARVLDKLTETAPMVIIVDSNHHDFLSKQYLQKGKYLNEPHNFKISHKMVSAMLDGHNPLQFAIESIIGIKHPEKVRWLKRDESYRVYGIELGAHGDKGSNGSPGSANTLEKAYGNCVVGHSHTPKIRRGFFQVGTSSYLKLPYTIGSSSWCHTSCLVYENGSRQLINSILGKWHK
jgi:hypothetical protein